MIYDDDKKCELLNKYFSLVSKLEEENVPVPPFESKTNDKEASPFLKIAITCAIFQLEGYLPCRKDLLKII
jgi:hypothetical protein